MSDWILDMERKRFEDKLLQEARRQNDLLSSQVFEQRIYRRE